MSVYRIKQVAKGRLVVEKKSWIGWEYIDSFSGKDMSSRAEERVKQALAEDAFRLKVLSIWSEKKPNGDKG